MTSSTNKLRWFKTGLVVLVLVLIVAVLAVPDWRNNALAQLNRLSTSPSKNAAASKADPHAGHDHGEGGHDEEKDENLLTLSREARRNIQLKVGKVELQDYTRSISLPGIVTEIPGKSRMEISAPLTGIVTGIEIIAGETVTSGDLVFRLRLTHEDLVSAQTEFLRTLGQLDVELKEVKRLKKISESGAVAGRVLLEKEYEVEKLESMLHAFRETLLLHGLSKEQVNLIDEHRSLLREVTISVPFLHQDNSIHDAMETFHRDPSIRRLSHSQSTANPSQDHAGSTDDEYHLRQAWFSVKEVVVHKGEAVQAGATLGVLTNYEDLYLEGHAYEQDMPELSSIVAQNKEITLVFQNSAQNPERLPGMKIKYLSNEVNPNTRTYHFYVELKNNLMQPEDSVENDQFLNWKYKPGQRAYVELPVETWTDRIVLPRDAVVDESASAFVFIKEGSNEYRRVEVEVLYRDRQNAVLVPNAQLKPGVIIAMRGTRQMYMALERNAGGGGDDHHGHAH
ncbi:hypothetical protein Pla110_03280 [Polystyrenella longa]|uniref:HlyD family secretion protein n=1 Tax=Polystyrenella longa TaxID=2528007 RepID=A0A518CHH8_9PLAN|nr:HlyD family efflux transporter periplasmic adaptor subunit [Polystyrenella longa]QDU78624.1 hypothetical protein Pla110_03280 [Polystyrenella longa]